jgi:hypothetical protein
VPHAIFSERSQRNGLYHTNVAKLAARPNRGVFATSSSSDTLSLYRQSLRRGTLAASRMANSVARGD